MTRRSFTVYEDSLIRTHWLSRSSDSIGAEMVPPRPGSAIRIRAKRLGLPAKVPGARNYGGDNGNFRHGKYRGQSRRRKRAIEPDMIPILARDFLRWRREAHGL